MIITKSHRDGRYHGKMASSKVMEQQTHQDPPIVCNPFNQPTKHKFRNTDTYLVGGLEHFLFCHILGMSSSQLTFIFFRGVGQPPTRYILNGPFIDGLPINSMVIFHGYVSHNQMVIIDNHYS